MASAVATVSGGAPAQLPGWIVTQAVWRQQDVRSLTMDSVEGIRPVHGQRFFHLQGGLRSPDETRELALKQRVPIVHRLARYTLGFWVQTIDLDMQSVRVTLALYDGEGKALPMRESDATPGLAMGQHTTIEPRTECRWMTMLGFHKFRFHWMEVPVGPWPSRNHTNASSVEIAFKFGGLDGRGEFLGHVFLDDMSLTLNPSPLLEVSAENDKVASVFTFEMARHGLMPPPADFRVRIASTVPVTTLQTIHVVVRDLEGQVVQDSQQSETLPPFDHAAYLGENTPHIDVQRRLGYFELTVTTHQVPLGSEWLVRPCSKQFDRVSGANTSFMVVEPQPAVNPDWDAAAMRKHIPPRFATWAYLAHYAPTLPLVGVQWTRHVRAWRRAESTRGALRVPAPGLEYIAHDKLLVLVTFSDLPRWASSAPDQDAAYMVYPPKDYNDFAFIIKRVLNRYETLGAVVGAVEVFNEPVRPWGWKGTLQELVQMHKTAYQTVKALNPDIPVLGPCFSPMDVLPRLRELMAEGLGEWIDGVTLHAYPLSLRYPRERGFREWLQGVRAMMLSYDMADDGLWLSEIGWHVEAANGFDELDQAHSLAQVYVLCVVESVNMCEWHNFADFRIWEKTTSPHGMVINSEEGLFRAKTPLAPHNPRPAAFVFSQVRNLLTGASFLYELDWLTPLGVHGYLLRTREGDAMIALLGPQDGAVAVQLPVCAATEQLSVMSHYTNVHHVPVRTVSAAADQAGVGLLVGGPVQCLLHQQDADIAAGHVRVASVVATKAVSFISGLDPAWLTGRAALHVFFSDGVSVSPFTALAPFTVRIVKTFVHYADHTPAATPAPEIALEVVEDSNDTSTTRKRTPQKERRVGYHLLVIHHLVSRTFDVSHLFLMNVGQSVRVTDVLNFSTTHVQPGLQKVHFELVETSRRIVVARQTVVLDVPPLNAMVDVDTCDGNLLHNPSFEMGKDRWYPFGFDDHGQTSTDAFNGLGAWEMQGMLPRYAKARMERVGQAGLERAIATTQRLVQRVELVPDCNKGFADEGLFAAVWLRTTSVRAQVFISLEWCGTRADADADAGADADADAGADTDADKGNEKGDGDKRTAAKGVMCIALKRHSTGGPGLVSLRGPTPAGDWTRLVARVEPGRIPAEATSVNMVIGRRGGFDAAEDAVVLDDAELRFLTTEEAERLTLPPSPAPTIAAPVRCAANLLVDPDFETKSSHAWTYVGFQSQEPLTSESFLHGRRSLTFKGMLPKYAKQILYQRIRQDPGQRTNPLQVYTQTGQRVVQRFSLHECNSSFAAEGVRASVWFRSTCPVALLFIGMEACRGLSGPCTYLRGTIQGGAGLFFHTGTTYGTEWTQLQAFVPPSMLPNDTVSMTFTIGRRGPYSVKTNVYVDSAEVRFMTADERAAIAGHENDPAYMTHMVRWTPSLPSSNSANYSTTSITTADSHSADESNGMENA